MKHRFLCAQQRASVLFAFISTLLALVALFAPTKSAEAATTQIINSTFSYAMKEVYDCSESWIYLDLNKLKMANGNDCSKHPHKYVWAALPSHFDKAQFGWNSNQTYDPSNTWENGVGAQVANCVEIQRELNGNYYAELTAGQTGTYIYQDISSEPGAIYKWSLRHCSRSKTHLDSMSVMIGSPSSQVAQNATRTTTNGLGNKTGSVGTIIATPSSANYDNERLQNVDWETYTGTYVIPNGQTTTRFTFKAISSAGPNAGNLVDDITFTRSYGLAYDLTGGTSSGIYSDPKANNYAGYHTEGSTFDLTTIRPVREGYTFLGWSKTKLAVITNQNAFNAAKPSLITKMTMPSTATTVFAVWAKNPTVTFIGAEGETLSSQRINFGSKATAPYTPFRTGYTFIDWDRSFSAVYSDITVKSLWQPNSYRISFQSQGGSGEMPDQQLLYDTAVPLCFNRYEKSGYLFAGWNSDPQGNGTTFTNEQIVENLATAEGSVIRLYAQWEPITYFVAFEATGGNGTMTDQELTFDRLASLNPNRFEREGFHWLKWNNSPFVPDIWYDNEEFVLNLADRANEVVTLYATWMANRCLVVFEENGGTGSMEAQSFAYDIAETLHPNTFEKEGAHWVSWNTAPDGTGTSYEDEQLVKNLRAEDNSTVVLYAQWEDDEPDEPKESETPPQDESNKNGQDQPPSTTPEENQPPAEAEPPDDADAGEGANDSLAPTESQPEPKQGDKNGAEQQDEAHEDKAKAPQQTSATSNDGSSTPKASFDKTGAATLGVMCVAFVLLIGGNAILIIGAHKHKRAREQRRRIFRSFIDS